MSEQGNSIQSALLRLDNARRALSDDDSESAQSEYATAETAYSEALKAAGEPVSPSRDDPLGTGTE